MVKIATFCRNCCVLVAAIDGIDRIRYTTSHPIEFTDDIIEVYEDTPEVVSFLHLPVQSGSDRISGEHEASRTRLSSTNLRSVSCAKHVRTSLSALTSLLVSQASLIKTSRIR